MYRHFFKYIIDFIFALTGLIVFSPVLFVLILWLYFFNNDHKVFFIQSRPGKNGKIFKIIKFKTMTDEKDNDGNFLPDVQRLTNFGKFVRETSFDEILQLVNVLKGDMSFVGPRPLLVKYLPLYDKKQARRHEVKPGITGWAQINGRNAISWVQKFEFDVWYVDNISFLLDMKIIFKTILYVFKKEGINSITNTTPDEFKG